MKHSPFLASLVVILALGASAFAQQGGTAQPAGATKGKVAVIDTAAVQSNILEVRAKLEVLEKQFEPRLKDLQTKADRITSLETTIQTQAQILGAQKVAELTEQLDSMKREYKRTGEDLQTDVNRARALALEPVQTKLNKFAESYMVKRGIIAVIDLPNAVQANHVIWFDKRLDITADFINEYNKANPAATTQSPPPAVKPK